MTNKVIRLHISLHLHFIIEIHISFWPRFPTFIPSLPRSLTISLPDSTLCFSPYSLANTLTVL